MNILVPKSKNLPPRVRKRLRRLLKEFAAAQREIRRAGKKWAAAQAGIAAISRKYGGR